MLAAGVLVLGLASLPLFSTVLPPLVDYPNHLARFALIAAGGNQFYAVRWAPLPNLAGDIVVPLLAQAMPLLMAGRLFLLAIFALILGGAVWLNRMAHGDWRLWPLLTAAFLYNQTFLWGFVNFLFGLGVALCGAALWLAAEGWPSWLRVLGSAVLSVVCFFSHIAAFGIYALLILGLELPPALANCRAREWRRLCRRIAIAFAQFAIPGAIFIAVWRPQVIAAFGYGRLGHKTDLLASVFDNYSRFLQTGSLALLALLFVGLAWRPGLRVAPRVAAALALVAAVYLLLPGQMLTGLGVDGRVPLVMFILLVAATAPDFASRRAALLVGGATAAVLLVRFVTIENIWLGADPVYRADLAAIDALPPGVRLAVAYPNGSPKVGPLPQLHMPTLAVWRRGAMVSTLFAHPAQQPIALKPPYDADTAADPTQLWEAFVVGNDEVRARAARALAGWDAVAFVDRRPFEVAPRRCLEPVLPQQPSFKIFLLRHGADCG